MSAANWMTLVLLVCTVLGLAWQIRRDSRKDRAEQLAAAMQAAREAAVLEERVRQLEHDRSEHDDNPR